MKKWISKNEKTIAWVILCFFMVLLFITLMIAIGVINTIKLIIAIVSLLLLGWAIFTLDEYYQ